MYWTGALVRMRTVVVLAAVTAVGCSTPRPRMETADVEIEETFPKQKQIEEIEPGERPESFFEERRTHVESWEMKGELPETVGSQPMTPDTPWERILNERIQAVESGAVATEGMNCLARQIGEFYLEHDAFPSGSLRVFLRTRCGVVARNYTKSWWTWEQKPRGETEKLAERWGASQGKALKKLAGGKHRSLGIWYGEDEDGAVLVAPVGLRQVDFESTSLKVESGESIVVEGTSHEDFSRLDAVHTRGAFGAGDCEVDSSVEPPEFRVRCPIDPETPFTQVDVTVYPGDRALGYTVFSNAFWRKKADGRTYRPTAASKSVAQAYRSVFDGEEGQSPTKAKASNDEQAGKRDADKGEEPVESASTSTQEDSSGGWGEEADSGREESGEEPDDRADSDATDDGETSGAPGSGEPPSVDEKTFAQLVNAVRKSAGLEPVTFESAESETARRLAGRYFRARFEESNSELTDEIARGLLAGWKVRAPIVSASFASHAVDSARPEILLDRLLATPTGRNVLLGDRFQRMAVGLTKTEKRDALGALVAVYRELPDETPKERAERAIQAINDARDDFDAASIDRDGSLDDKVAQIARRVESNQLDMDQAQRQLVTQAARLWNTRVQLVGMISRSLGRVRLHEKLRTAPVESAAVLVVPYRPEGVAWTTYVIFLVHPATSDSMADTRPPSQEGRERAAFRMPGDLWSLVASGPWAGGGCTGCGSAASATGGATGGLGLR